MFTAKKIKKMDEEYTFVIGYRNLLNIALIFISAWAYLTSGGTPDIVIMATIVFVLAVKWFYVQMLRNLDDLEIRALEKKEG
jgi:hypothetical protein